MSDNQSARCPNCRRELDTDKCYACVDISCPLCGALPYEDCWDPEDDYVDSCGIHRERRDLWSPPPTQEQIERVLALFETS